MPAVTVEFKLNGLPTANTHSPTFNASESPTGIVGEIITLNFHQRKVGARVSTNHASLKLTVIIQFHTDFIRTFNHMIIRYDISILRDDYSRTKTYTRLRLYLTLLSASITKKEIENVRRLLNSSCF